MTLACGAVVALLLIASWAHWFPHVLLMRFTFTCPRACSFQAVSDIERNEWLDAIRMAILKGLDDERHVERGSVPSSHDILDRICQNASNRTCADCNSDSECVGR